MLLSSFKVYRAPLQHALRELQNRQFLTSMAFFLGQMIVLLAVLAVVTKAFNPKINVLTTKIYSVPSYSGRMALHMGSHGIYDIKSDNGVHSISFEV